MKRRLAALLVPAVLIVTGCTAAETRSPATPAPPPRFADCSTLTSATPAAPPTRVRYLGSLAPALTGLSLPCFGGNDRVALDELPGPAVINLWASWCPPCRQELPVFQRLAVRAAGSLYVLGVNTRDDRPRAESVAVDLGLTFPTVYDPGEELRSRLARPGLPITLFVDGQGMIRHIDESGALDDAELTGLLERHLGVVVPA